MINDLGLISFGLANANIADAAGAYLPEHVQIPEIDQAPILQNLLLDRLLNKQDPIELFFASAGIGEVAFLKGLINFLIADVKIILNTAMTIEEGIVKLNILLTEKCQSYIEYLTPEWEAMSDYDKVYAMRSWGMSADFSTLDRDVARAKSNFQRDVARWRTYINRDIDRWTAHWLRFKESYGGKVDL